MNQTATLKMTEIQPIHFRSVLNELEEAGTAQNRKVYARHGVEGEMFGVSFAILRKMGKRLRPDSELAAELWATGNHDARVLSCMVDDPDAATKADLVKRAEELGNYIIVDEFAALVAKTPFAAEFARRWKASRSEWLGALSWTLVAHLALTKPDKRGERNGKHWPQASRKQACQCFSSR